jgi:hypothetical protein
MSAITLLDGSLKLTIFYEETDRQFDDDICLCFEEDCPEDEKIFKADEVSIYLTPEQAALIVLELSRAMHAYRGDASPDQGGSGG